MGAGTIQVVTPTEPESCTDWSGVSGPLDHRVPNGGGYHIQVTVGLTWALAHSPQQQRQQDSGPRATLQSRGRKATKLDAEWSQGVMMPTSVLWALGKWASLRLCFRLVKSSQEQVASGNVPSPCGTPQDTNQASQALRQALNA